MKKLSLIGILSAVLLVACQTQKNDNEGDVENQNEIKVEDKNGVISKEDEDFAINLAVEGMEEVELGKLAERKGESEQVREFGKHTAHKLRHVGHDLKRLSKKKYITLPDSLSLDNKSAKEELEKLHGKAFDEAYMNAMVEGHKKVLACMEKEDVDTKDPDIKAFTERTIPIIKEHLQMAEMTDSVARAQR